MDESSSANLGPKCMVCFMNIDMSKQIKGWTCPNQHQSILCNKCFGSLTKDECPTCRHPIPDISQVRSLRRHLGLASVVQTLVSNIKTFQDAVNKYDNEEILDVYMEKMLESSQETKKPFVERLQKQAKLLINQCFMLELQAELIELKEIDSFIQITDGSDEFKDSFPCKVFKAIKEYNKKFLIKNILKKHPGAIIIDQAAN